MQSAVVELPELLLKVDSCHAQEARCIGDICISMASGISSLGFSYVLSA